ncbi:MAG: hypothetical protein HC767_12305 [Akkermansiaceae bacterium]|nr:hypothetical protein [Akkermansiaceae bacterium]
MLPDDCPASTVPTCTQARHRSPSCFAGELDADEGFGSARTAEQTRTGIFWAYDGGFRIGVPPRLYNQITDDIIIGVISQNAGQLATGFQLVRLYAMVNVALADAGIAVCTPAPRNNNKKAKVEFSTFLYAVIFTPGDLS